MQFQIPAEGSRLFDGTPYVRTVDLCAVSNPSGGQPSLRQSQTNPTMLYLSVSNPSGGQPSLRHSAYLMDDSGNECFKSQRRAAVSSTRRDLRPSQRHQRFQIPAERCRLFDGAYVQYVADRPLYCFNSQRRAGVSSTVVQEDSTPGAPIVSNPHGGQASLRPR